MLQNMTKRFVALLIVVIMITSMIPMTAFADDSTGSVTNYEDFMTNLKVLETYADEYGASVYRDPGELVLNFIRTGVDRYLDDNWMTLAGQEIIGFTNYVKMQDEEHNTTAMALRDIVIDDFVLPNGNLVDFGHMFGCMNISYVNIGSADLSGWAGDLCDLLRYCVEIEDSIPKGTVEEMASYIRANCLGVNASEAFGWDDFWGDMDAYYLISEYKKSEGSKKFSEIMDEYFTASLNDTDRTVYFMNNRFAVEDSQAAVRKAIFEAYSSDVGIKILESKRGLSTYNALREACCYAIADYIYENAQGKLIEGSGDGEAVNNGYYTVFSDEETILAPGIQQNIKYAQTVDGKQIVYYVATVDVNREDVMIKANYKDNDPSKGWGLQSVMDQTNALVKNYESQYEYFTPVVATNGDGYNIYNGTPGGLLVMDGKEWYGVDHDGFFAILDDGSAVIGTQAEYEIYKDRIQEAIGGFGAVLVKDGKINVTKNANYTASRASRTAVGITADGKVVMMVMDGRQQPFSAGGAMEEIAQVMLEAGCVHAINLDGGGSTTYLSKPAGSDSIQLTNRPSDGYQRLVAVSLVAISTAKPSNEFDSAIISSDYEYITPGTSMQFTATGISNTGNAAAIPEGAYWRVSDETLATIDETGLFTAMDYGKVTVEFVVGEEIKGSKDIEVVIPDDVQFVEERITAIYGESKDLLLTLWYEGKPVAFNTETDIIIGFLDNNYQMIDPPGIVNGLTFTPDINSNIRIIRVVAVLMIDTEVGAVATINLYNHDEATFDFDNATMGNRSLAWTREIENARSTDNKLYRITDNTKPVNIDYTFALDMTAIEMPARLEPLKSMLPDGTNPDTTAWDFLLSLAERVCVQTNVKIVAEFSPELNVDISDLKILTDYFTLTSADLAPNNVLTVVCNWKDQTQAISPAIANPLCILTGIKATLKDNAAFYNNEVVITNNGNVYYDIYLATSALHSFASDPANQAQFGLYPYTHSDVSYPDGCRIGDHDSGGHFASQYLDFADVYVLNNETLKGWQEEDGEYYYYKNNAPVTGTQLVPDRKNASQMCFYKFDETGKLISEQGVNGLITFEGDLYYATLGVITTGWYEVNGNFYYFDPDTGKAVDGTVTLKEYIYPDAAANDPRTSYYTYTFTDHILTRGEFREEYEVVSGGGKQLGIRYRWAGSWISSCWFEVDGETYHAGQYFPYFITTGYAHYVRNYPSEENWCYLFDDRGALMKDFTGAAYIESRNEYRLFVNGEMPRSGYYDLYLGSDGYYYTYNTQKWDGTAFTNTTVNVPANKYIPAGTYTFDEFGRLSDDLLTGNVEITDNTVKEGEQSTVTTNIVGDMMTVTNANDDACKVIYKDNSGYHAIDAKDATENGANFKVPVAADEAIIVVTGDADGNGKVEVDDASALQSSILNKDDANVDEMGKLAGDIDNDSKLSVIDVALAKAAALGKFQLAW